MDNQHRQIKGAYPRERGVVDIDADVMQALAVLFDEPGDRTVGTHRGDQLHPSTGMTGGAGSSKHCHTHFLIQDIFNDRGMISTEELPSDYCRIKLFDGYADV